MMLMRTAKSCGPGAPTLASSLRDFLQTTVARKPGHTCDHCYSDVCFLNPATSCAVSCDGLAPKRAVT